MQFKISGSRQASRDKDKAITFGYKAKSGTNIDGFLNFINTNATVPCLLKSGHKSYVNVKAIFDWIRLDLDTEGEREVVEKILKKHNMWYIFKPSTNNHLKPYKWHVLIAVSNVAQDVEHYKWQAHEFLLKYKIEIDDLSVTRSVVQNMNPYRNGDYPEEALKKTYVHEGDILPLEDVPDGLRGFQEKQKIITWASFGAGNHHTGMTGAIAKDYSLGNSRSVLEEKIRLYVLREFREDQFNEKLTEYLDILDWTITNVENETCDTSTLMDMCNAEMDAKAIVLVLKKAEDAIEREVLTKHIKKLTKLSEKAIRQAYTDSMKVGDGSGEQGISKYFAGSEIVWDDQLGLFVEITTSDEVVFHKKSNFPQTLMSASGWMKPTDVSEVLCQIERKNIIYDPTSSASKKGVVNIYRKIPIKGTYHKIPRTIRRVLTNLFRNDKKALDVFINWMAVIVQKGIRTGVAWGFFGASGSGKGLIVDIFKEILGSKNCSINVGDVALQSAFNPYAINKQFIHLNEISSDFHSRHGVSNKVKPMISDSIIQVNQKGIPEMSVENFGNIILNSNKPNPFELDPDDRRWNMIQCDVSLTALDFWKGDDTYQKALGEWKLFAKYLNNYEIDFKKATTPMELSVAKLSVIKQTTPTLKLIGDAIKKGDVDTIVELLGIDEEEMSNGITKDDITKACATGDWISTLLNRIYGLISNKSTYPPSYPSLYFIKPYVTDDTSKPKRLGGVLCRVYELNR